MWMYQTIESKYYEFGDFKDTEQFNLGKTFMKGAIGTHGFFNYIITSDYIKMAEDSEFTENVLTIRRSSLKDDTFENGVYVNADRAIVLAVKAYDRIELKIDISKQAKLYYGEPDFTDACKAIYKGRNPQYGNTDLTLKLIELYYNYILPKYGVNYIWLIEENSNYDKQFNALIYKITNFVNSTYKYYSPLIDAYLVNESHLLDKIQTIVENEASSEGSGTSISLQNDTPGELNEGYDPTHTSFASKETNSNTSGSSSTATYSKDVEPLIDKLNRIRTKYADLYTEWADRFESILCGFNF